MTTAPPTSIQQLTLFFGILTPGMERALREGFGLEANPRLEDIRPVPRETSEEAAALLLTVRDRIRLAFPSTFEE